MITKAMKHPFNHMALKSTAALQKLQKEGKIQGWAEKASQGAVMKPHRKKKDAGAEAKAWITQYLTDLCAGEGWHLHLESYVVPGRKFKADWAIPDKMVMVEYEGLNSAKSRHTTIGGYTTDTEKYNLAQAAGWRVVRVTILNYRKLPFFIDKILSK